MVPRFQCFSSTMRRRRRIHSSRDSKSFVYWAFSAIDLIYVHSPDRLARRYAYQVLLLGEFVARGVRVVPDACGRNA